EEITEQTNKILANYKNVKEAEKEIDAEKLKNNVHDVLITEKVLVLLEEIVLGEKPNSLKLKVKS
ncbi:hypothetical protein KKE99_02660, partial [Patescibacteria group bacterium]|nr:hypothetical protein [Patescibacteria group bacterium]